MSDSISVREWTKIKLELVWSFVYVLIVTAIWIAAHLTFLAKLYHVRSNMQYSGESIQGITVGIVFIYVFLVIIALVVLANLHDCINQFFLDLSARSQR